VVYSISYCQIGASHKDEDMRSTSELQLISLLGAVALAAGLLTGQMAWCLFLAAITWIIRQYSEFEKLRNWTNRPLQMPPDLSETWYQLANVPYRQLIRERTRTRTVLARIREIIGVTELLPDAVILLDETGAIETTNSTARSLFQLKKSDIGLALASIVRSPDFAQFLRDENEMVPLEFASPFNPDQQLEARCFESESGRRLILIRDITSSNRLLTMRQQFVANVSHELRTPLTVVNGYLETINDETASDELRLQLLDRFTAPMNRMHALVEDLLLLTQLEASPALAEPREVNMSSLINNAVNELQPLQSFPGQITVRNESTHRIIGTEKELHSVCVNLLSNAIRYSGAEGAIEISWETQGENARLCVADNGIGIPSEYLDRLTERFFRIDASGAQARGGTGLGLAIVKHVLKRHSSELHVESELNKGSKFYCEFTPAPVRADKEASNAG
jgi:two-component system phosphate regulon sensor histidine kinase PhoR